MKTKLGMGERFRLISTLDFPFNNAPLFPVAAIFRCKGKVKKVIHKGTRQIKGTKATRVRERESE
jgi:hypothetical protein